MLSCRSFPLALVAVLLAFCLGHADAIQGCPSFTTTPSIKKTVNAGKRAKLAIKVANNADTPVNGTGLMLTLPPGVTYWRMTTSPKQHPKPSIVQDGGNVAWTGIDV